MSYSIITADLSKNKKDIYNIWEKNYPGVFETKFQWIYEKNPAGSALVWLVRHDDSGEFVGTTALFPRRFVVDGKSLTGGITGDLLVNKDHRSAGPALMLQRNVLSACQEKTVDFIYGFPNKAAEPILKRTGYKVLGERVRLVKILKTAPQLSKLPFGKYWGFFLSPFLDFLVKLMSIETWHFGEKNFACKEIQEFDARFDRLWKKVDRQFTVTGERMASYLTWRFLEVPQSRNKIFAVFDKDKRYIRGYIIYFHGTDSVEVKDFYYEQDKKILVALFSNFFRYVKLSGAQSATMHLLENENVISQMKTLGFTERKDGAKVLVYFPKEALSEFSSLQDKDNWLLFQSDDDDI